MHYNLTRFYAIYKGRKLGTVTLHSDRGLLACARLIIADLELKNLNNNSALRTDETAKNGHLVNMRTKIMDILQASSADEIQFIPLDKIIEKA